jgi:type IV secretory pathway TraG/TraD family ATPase VirD4
MQIDELMRAQKAKYESRQTEPLWAVPVGFVGGLLCFLLCVIAAQNLVARDLGHDPILGKPTVGSIYLSPMTMPLWRLKCFQSRVKTYKHPFPACEQEPSRSAAMAAFAKYDTMLMVAGAVCFAVGLICGLSLRESRKAKPVQTHGDAQWATFEEISDANLIPKLRPHTGKPLRVGVPLGVLRHNGKTYYVRTDDEQPLGVVIVGPPNSGKTACFYVPHLLMSPESAFVNDPSGELWRKTAGNAASADGFNNICMLFAPEEPEISCHINPADSVKWETRKEIATLQNLWKRLLDHADRASEGAEAHWIATGAVLGECTLIHLYYTDRKNCNFAGVYDFLMQFDDSADGKTFGVDVALQYIMNHDHRQGRTDLDVVFRDHEGQLHDAHPYSVGSAKETFQKAPNEKSGVISVMRRFMHVFRDPEVAECTRDSSLSLEDMQRNERAVKLYYKVSPNGQQRLRPLQNLLTSLITSANMADDAYDLETGEFLFKHWLSIDFDEAAQAKKQEDLFLKFAVSRKYGIFPILGYQDVSQIWAAAGGVDQESVMTVLPHKVFLRPNKPETAEWISSKILGKTTAKDFVRMLSGQRVGFMGHAQASEQYVSTDLMSAPTLQKLPNHVALVKSGRVAPFLVETLYYENDPELLRRSKIKPPAKSMTIPLEKRAYVNPWERESLPQAGANGAAVRSASRGEALLERDKQPERELVAVGAQSSAIAENVPTISTSDPEASKKPAFDMEAALAAMMVTSEPTTEPERMPGPAFDEMNG